MKKLRKERAIYVKFVVDRVKVEEFIECVEKITPQGWIAYLGDLVLGIKRLRTKALAAWDILMKDDPGS